MLKKDMAEYYAKRAATYEEIYTRPEREDELVTLQVRVQELLQGHDVLELGCGTGFWTKELAASAKSVTATDINPDVMKLAQAKGFPADKVRFAVADALNLQLDRPYTAVFFGFLWSHIAREDQNRFLLHLRERVGPNTFMVMLDNSYVEGSSTTIARTDLLGNTFQHRRLPGDPHGDRYEILKNFPSDSNLRKRLASDTRDLRILRMEHYWLLNCRLK